jgi:uncharacterized protein (TIGR03437 family)
MTIKTTLLVFLLGACAWQCSAQSETGFDSSGDGMLNGTYYMRQAFYVIDVQTGAMVQSLNVQGNITFDGAGNYTFSGAVENTASTPNSTALTTGGSYAISGSGAGYINAVDQTFSTDNIFGTVSQGLFIGTSTSTGSGYNDLFIAAPVGSTATNSTLKGTYAVAYMDPTFPGDAMFSMTADGQGNIGSVSVTGYTGANTTATTQSLSGVTYSFTNGAAEVKFGGTRNTSTLVAGTEVLYISPDGNFIFGGSASGYDMFVGVRAATSAPSNYAGLYYQAGLGMDELAAGNGLSVLDSYYGAFEASSGKIIGHQQFSTASLLNYRSLTSLSIYGGASDFTYYDSYTLNDDGSSDDTAFSQHYVSSADGTIRIGYGIGPLLSLNVAIQAPAASGSGVYLSPMGVVNAASSAPFTAPVSDGEFITLYGSGLANTTASSSLPFPTLYNGVQVMINQVAAPIYYVSPTQISVVVPFGTESNPVAQIYVINNGTQSNLVTEYTGTTSLGVFTNNPEGGLGYAAALHPDYSVISESSPAKIGETVALYLTGMGQVAPRVQNGAPAPSSPLSYTTFTPLVFLLDASGNYLSAKVGFTGLAPGYAGLYQINFTVPSGLVSGKAWLEIIGPDSDTFQAILPLTTN